MPEPIIEIPLYTLIGMIVFGAIWQIIMQLIYAWTGQTPRDRLDALKIVIREVTDSVDKLIPRFRFYDESLRNYGKKTDGPPPDTPENAAINLLQEMEALQNEVGRFTSMIEPKIEQNKYDLQEIKRTLNINGDEDEAKVIEKKSKPPTPKITTGTESNT